MMLQRLTGFSLVEGDLLSNRSVEIPQQARRVDGSVVLDPDPVDRRRQLQIGVLVVCSSGKPGAGEVAEDSEARGSRYLLSRRAGHRPQRSPRGAPETRG